MESLKQVIRMRNMVILFIIIISIVILVKWTQKWNYVMKYEPLLLNKVRKIGPMVIPNKKIIKSSNGGLIYAYSFWIYMENVSGSENWNINYYDDRNIFRKGANPIFYYNPENNVYKVGISTSVDDEIIETFDIENVPLQRWNHFVISLENRNMDVFVNGVLKHSYVLNNVPILNDNSLIIGSMKTKINGSISSLRYFNRNITKKEVYRLYTLGNRPRFYWWLYP